MIQITEKYIDLLPIDILINILNQLSISELNNASLVCQKWAKLIHNQTFWLQKLRDYYPDVAEYYRLNQNAQHEITDYYTIFKENYFREMTLLHGSQKVIPKEQIPYRELFNRAKEGDLAGIYKLKKKYTCFQNVSLYNLLNQVCDHQGRTPYDWVVYFRHHKSDCNKYQKILEAVFNERRVDGSEFESLCETIKCEPVDQVCIDKMIQEKSSDYLDVAVKYGRLDWVKQLIERGVSSKSCLHKAAEKGHIEIVKYLLTQQTVKLDVKNKNRALYLAAENGHVEIVKYLHKVGADINKADMKDHCTALAAAIRKDQHLVVEYLATQKAKVILIDEELTPLEYALQIGCHYTLKYLLKHTDVIERSRPNIPLGSIKKGDMEIVELLCAHNIQMTSADIISAAVSNREEILEYILETNPQLISPHALTISAHYDHLAAVKLIISKKVDIKIPYMYMLYSAIKNKKNKIVEYLLQQGITNIQDITDSSGFDHPFIHALRANNEVAAGLLVAYGATINEKDSNGYTSLSHAVKKRKLNLVYMLLAMGADIGSNSRETQTHDRSFVSLLDQASAYDRELRDLLYQAKKMPEFTQVLQQTPVHTTKEKAMLLLIWYTQQNILTGHSFHGENKRNALRLAKAIDQCHDFNLAAFNKLIASEGRTTRHTQGHYRALLSYLGGLLLVDAAKQSTGNKMEVSSSRSYKDIKYLYKRQKKDTEFQKIFQQMGANTTQEKAQVLYRWYGKQGLFSGHFFSGKDRKHARDFASQLSDDKQTSFDRKIFSVMLAQAGSSAAKNSYFKAIQTYIEDLLDAEVTQTAESYSK